jgi:hypothetical protein
MMKPCWNTLCVVVIEYGTRLRQSVVFMIDRLKTLVDDSFLFFLMSLVSDWKSRNQLLVMTGIQAVFSGYTLGIAHAYLRRLQASLVKLYITKANML